jgi:hypothetical protein
VHDLTTSERKKLREAFAALQAISDDRGYQYLAGIHGLPLPAWCDRYGHGKPTFLHWHRAYLYRFELALRATGHDVMLPWWDWINQPEIPTLYGDEHTPEGTTNPLFSVRINDLALQQGRKGLGGGLSRYPENLTRGGSRADQERGFRQSAISTRFSAMRTFLPSMRGSRIGTEKYTCGLADT